ncbi:rab-GTPase-TBC domain-containing protein [Phyllosticta citricarpa]
MDGDYSRPLTASSDNDNVSEPHPPRARSSARELFLGPSPTQVADATFRRQDNFQDATAAMSRSNSGERSLIGRPLSTASSSTANYNNKREADSPANMPPTPIEYLSPSPPPESPIEASDDDKDEASRKKSPLPTSHPEISTETMDEVNLDEEAKKSPEHSRTTTLETAPPKPVEEPTIPATAQRPAVQLSPPPPPQENKPPPAEERPTAKRTFTSPFAWIARASEKKSSPPGSARGDNSRRGTNASVMTNGSSDLMLSRLEDNGLSNSTSHPRSSRNSLKDRFKFARMREEAGITLDEDNLPDAVKISTPNFASPADDGEGQASPPGGGVASPGGTATSLVNPSLAPGTASGTALGPDGDAAAPVDWDLWQSVVYEGPAAVARTSPEELNAAIASGIPQPIRGVVWQVLAQSKNEGLEEVYRELVNRGTDRERVALNLPQLNRNDSNADVRKNESVTSSASSVHSNYSTPATTTTGGTAHGNGVASPTTNGQDGDISDATAKLQDEKRKKAKAEQAAALAKLEKAIKRDLGARTSYSKYLMAAGLQDGLFNLCKAYALFDEQVGYPQGVNFVAMPLLFNMPEEEAFCLMVKLMNKYGLRDLFIQDMPGLHLHLYQFERLLEEFEPALYCHLHRRGVNPQLYATQWFLTLFAYRFPLQLVLRVYDLILSEGLEGAILKFGICLMQKNAQTLLGMKDMAQLTTFLKERLFDVYIDKAPTQKSLLESGFFGSAAGVDNEIYRADRLVQDACSVKITPEMLQVYQNEWREKQHAEMMRENELLDLKSSVSSLTSKVRTLEERAEKSDTEHVELASELVRTKVENERLQDENESLKGQVEELRKLVDAQAADVEARMQGELEAAMARNAEVHNANRALEEQLAEMERELVETKMQHAQVSLPLLKLTEQLLICARSIRITKRLSRSGVTSKVCLMRSSGFPVRSYSSSRLTYTSCSFMSLYSLHTTLLPLPPAFLPLFRSFHLRIWRLRLHQHKSNEHIEGTTRLNTTCAFRASRRSSIQKTVHFSATASSLPSPTTTPSSPTTGATPPTLTLNTGAPLQQRRSVIYAHNSPHRPSPSELFGAFDPAPHPHVRHHLHTKPGHRRFDSIDENATLWDCEDFALPASPMTAGFSGASAADEDGLSLFSPTTNGTGDDVAGGFDTATGAQHSSSSSQTTTARHSISTTTKRTSTSSFASSSFSAKRHSSNVGIAPLSQRQRASVCPFEAVAPPGEDDADDRKAWKRGSLFVG